MDYGADGPKGKCGCVVLQSSGQPAAVQESLLVW